MPISAGQLDRRVELQGRITARGADGSVTETYATLATVWAKIRPIRGREYWAAQQVNAEITHEVVIRYQARFRPTSRIKYHNRHFNVLSAISPDEGHDALVLMCKEVVDVGTG